MHSIFFLYSQAGGWLLLQGRAHLLAVLWLHLYRWADWAGRARAMPHIKSYTQPLRTHVPATAASFAAVVKKYHSLLPSQLREKAEREARAQGYLLSAAVARELEAAVSSAGSAGVSEGSSASDAAVVEDTPLEW